MIAAIKKQLAAGVMAAGLVVASFAATASPADAATPKPRAGVTCVKINAKAKVSNTNLKCLKTTSGKLRWTPVTPAGKIIVSRASLNTSSVPATPSADAMANSSVQTAAKGPSGYEIVADPNNGGSPEVVYPDPIEAEQPNSALAPAPANIAYENLTENSFDITFTPTPGVELFQVYLRYDDSFTAKGADASHTRVHFDNLSPGWDYVACAYYLSPRESAKACVNIHTLGTTPHWQNYLPGPTGVVATAVDDTIEVAWDELPNAERYSVSIEYNTSFQSGGYSEIGGARNHIRFNAGSVSPGLRYNVRVSALLTSGDWTVETLTTVRSNGSQPAPPVKLPAPTNLRVIDVTPSSVTIAWDVPAESTDVTVWSVVARYQTSFTSIGAYPQDRQFTIPNLNPGYGYQIIVSGYNSNTGKWTNEATTSVVLPNL